MQSRHADSRGVIARSGSRFRPLPAAADTKNGLTGASRGLRERNGRRRGKGRWAYIVITVILVSSIGFALARSSSMQKSHTNYDPHGVILVDSDSELQAQATAEGWQGDGGELNPFIIRGYEIAAMGYSKGIYVGNTSYHLIIDSCYVHDATLACISLFNVTNATVTNSECVNGQKCIEVASSSLVNIIGNNCTMADEGVYLLDSEWCSAVGNNCSGNIIGMSAQGCGNLSMQLNSAHGNVISGMQVSLTRYFLLANNTCTGGQFGVMELLSEFGSTLNSTATDSSDSGFYLSSCHACSVEDSRSSGHGSCGISIEDSSGCRVRGNEASDNGHGVRGLRCDDLEVRGNDCGDNREHGICVEDSGRCTLADNHCHGNDGDGMGMGRCHDGRAEGNRCEGNGGSGLRCYDGERCHVGQNTCTDNGDCGVRCHGLVQGEITRNDLGRSHGDGICLALCSDVNVSDNVCSESSAGIRFSMCNSCYAYNNTVDDSVFGIAVSDSVGVVLSENRMTNDGIFIEGPMPEHWGTHDIGPTNSVNGLPVLYLVSAVGLVIVGTPGQIILTECLDIRVDGLDLSNATVGVELAFSDGVTVSNSTCSDGYIGVYGYGSYGLKVENSNCSRNLRSGLELSMCSSGEVWRTTCEDNEQYGMHLSASTACEVTLCRLSGSAEGISTESTLSAGLFVDNEISNCASGVVARSAENIQLHLNEIRDCDYGVRLADSPSMSMVGNTLVGCGLYIESDFPACWNSHMVDPGNSVNGRTLAYLVGASGMSLPSSTGQAVLAECTWITAASLDLSDCTVGVLAGFSSHISVIGCDLSDNQVGVEFAHCDDGSIMSNVVTDCVSEGVRLRGSSGNVVEDNEVLRCGIGICVCEGLSLSTGNRIIDNNASEGMHGAMVTGSPETMVQRNSFLSNLACGVMVGMSDRTVIRNNTCNGSGDMAISIWGSNGCTIDNNSCSLNRRGVYLWGSLDCNISGNVLYGNAEFGVCLDSACSGNRVWNNVLAYNNGSMESHDPLHAQACDNGGDNRWNSSDSPHGYGNYWHDWAVPDVDMDGIVDVPYNVSGSANAKDYYPLASTSVPIEPIPEFGLFFVFVSLVGLVLLLGRRRQD